MKPALFYTLRNNLNMDVVAVTSVRDRGYRKDWNGRYHKDNCPTHGQPDQFTGRFDTLQEAESVRSDMEAIRRRYRPLHDDINKQKSALWASERDEIAELMKPYV